MRGGYREGSGRPLGTGYYGEPTKVLRLPISMVFDVLRYVENKAYKLPLYSCTVAAGFPSPADDYLEDAIDLNSLLVKNPPATFFVRAKGDSMKGASINDGDLLVVDRSVKPTSGKIVIAAQDGMLTVKRLRIKQGVAYLVPENPDFPSIQIDPENGVMIWGVVTNVIHSL